MNAFFEFLANPQLNQFILYAVGLLVIWFVLSFVLKLAKRLLSLGCILIVALGLFFVLVRILG
jgi:hypothetical protein